MRRRRTATLLALLVLAPWLVWAVVRTLGLDRGYPLVPAVSFTQEAAATSVVPLLLALVLRRWWITGLALATCIAFAAAVLPRALPDRDGGGTGPTVVVMNMNMLLGHADPAAIVALVRREHVDVLALEEMTPQAVTALDAAGVRAELPHRVLAAGPAASGTGLMTRMPIVDRGEVGRPGVAAAPQGTVRVAGRPLRLTAAHPYPPLTPARARDWARSITALPSAAAGGMSNLIAGDLNATLDHHALRGLLDRGYRDAAAVSGDGLEPTWPVGDRSHHVPLTIDHVLVPQDVGVRDVSVHVIPGSDHRAVVAHLRVGG